MELPSVAYTAKYIFDGDNLLSNMAVIVCNDIIMDIVSLNQISDKLQIINYGDCIITAGFIDLQINGCGGILFNDDISHSSLSTIHKICLQYGTTSFLPTLITCGFDDVLLALNTIKDWFAKYGANRGVIGLHLEGPFIAPDKKGIHQQQFIQLPKAKLLEQIVEYRQYFPIKMTIAPEVFTSSQIKFLIDNDIILSLGHSNASYEVAQNAINLGVKSATHMFNAMSGLVARSPGVIGAVLNSNIYTSVIVDMLHVDKANIQLLNKIKATNTYLVTDAVTSMGTNMQQFNLYGKTIYVKNGMCIDKDGVLAGTNLNMLAAVTNCVNLCGIEITQALKMASLIPAQLMGYANYLGKIQIAYKSNLIMLDLNKQICQVIN
jgi:N-acetylglucosamine-6-phosphate deacetylase